MPYTNSASIYFNNDSKNAPSASQYLYNPTPYSNLNISGDFTIEYWMLANTQGNALYPAILAVNQPWAGNSIDVCVSHVFNPGKMFIETQNGFTYSTNSNVCDGVWHNVALVRKANNLSIYVDGTLSGTPQTASSNWLFGNLAIGTVPKDTNINVGYTGYISNFRICNTALYNGNYTRPIYPYTNIIGTLLLLNTLSTNPLLDGSNYNQVFSYSSNSPTVSTTVYPPLIERPPPPPIPYKNAASIYFSNQSNYGPGLSQCIYNNTSYSNLNLSSDFTIEFWMLANIQSYASSAMIIGINQPWTTNSIDLSVTHATINPGKLSLSFYNGVNYTTNSNVCDGVWHNIALVRNSNVLSIYIDGTLTGTRITESSTWNFSKLSIGTIQSDTNTELGYTGYFSNLRICNSALYSANYTAPTNPYTNIPGTLLLLNTFSTNPLLDGSTYNQVFSYSSNSPTVSTTVYPPLVDPPPPPPPPIILCFKEDTKILAMDGYKKIQELKDGDFVKTVSNGYVEIEKIASKLFTHNGDTERIKNQLYICKKDNYSELFEDLVITGCHSILVDEFVDEEQKENVIRINGDTYITDDYYRLPACVDNRAVVYDKTGEYFIYHFALKHKDSFMNYGVYANGLLVESCSMHNLKKQFDI